ncbi:hypothetical protein AB9P05_06360 [Roseivirga sp. BDSF3-8]|uniref:hypothetical protein n=1 Tax=Roseivirga sp. BDSF3-8 TaxID=3241598 RepID=UPI00353279B0
MRRLTNYAALLAMMGAIFLFSCGDDEEIDPIGVGDSPAFTFTGEDADSINRTAPVFRGAVGESFDVNVAVNAPNGFNVLRIYKVVDGTRTETLEEYVRTTSGQTDFDANFSYVIEAEDADNLTEIEFEAVDDENETTTESIEIIVNEPAVNMYSAVLLAAPLADGSSNTFFSSENGNIYSDDDVTGTTEDISSTIDFGYYYGNTDAATLASPAAYPSEILSLSGWNTLNNTELRITALSSSQFNELNTPSSIQNAFTNATAGGDPEIASGLTAGTVIAFMTDTDKPGGANYGVLIVDSIIPGTGADGEIQLTVKAVN